MSSTHYFKQFGQELANAFDERVHFLGKTVADVQGIREDTQKMLRHFRNERRARAKGLCRDLGGFMKNLQGTVEEMRETFQGHQKGLRKDLQGGHKAMEEIGKTMAAKRKHFARSVAQQARQYASH